MPTWYYETINRNIEIVKETYKREVIQLIFNTRGWFHQHVHTQLLHAQVSKVQKDNQVVSVFLYFWDLHSQKLLIKCSWNRPQNCTTVPLDILLDLFGPLGTFFCSTFMIMKYSFFVHMIMAMTGITIVKYLSIFVLKNPAGLHCEFWFQCKNINSFFYYCTHKLDRLKNWRSCPQLSKPLGHIIYLFSLSLTISWLSS